MPKIRGKKQIRLLACLLAVSLAAVALAIARPGVAKATEYDEKDPELTFVTINSDIEFTLSGIPEYTPYGKYSQGNGKYTLETNAYTVWDKKDEIGFGYRQYDIGSAKTDTLTVEADLTDFKGVGTGGKYFTASAGVMIRGSLDPASPEVMVHVREGNVGVLCRKAFGAGTSYTASGASPADITGLRIEKTGEKYVCSYRLQGMGWVTFKTLRMEWNGPFLGGLAVHSSDRDNPVACTFTNFKAYGSGTYIPGEEPGGNTSSETVSVTPWEDAPMPENCLLYETFTDMNLSARDGKTPDKTVWKNFNGTIELEENGNRRKYNSFKPCEDYIGNSKWTDYSAAMDFQVTADTDPKDNDYFTFIVRCKTIETTGRYGYELKFVSTYDQKTKQTSCFIELYRKFRSDNRIMGKAEIPSYFDFKTHNIRVDVVDNLLKVFFDDQPVSFTSGNSTTTVVTDTSPIVMATGGLGITSSEDMDIYFDNIIVTKLNDPVGGDYDNFIGGNWDSDVPEYAQKFSETYGKALY